MTDRAGTASGTTALTWEQSVARLRSDPGQAALVHAAYFDLPVYAAAQRYHASAEWNAVRGFLPAPGGRALDLGAGNGIASFALAEDGWRVVALEPDPSAEVGAAAIAEVAAVANSRIAVLRGVGEAIPVRSGCMDLVFARQVLHHARDLNQLCREIARVLRLGGILVTARDHVVSSRRDLPKFLARHPLHRWYGGENAFLEAEYSDALTAAGMRVIRRLGPFESDINIAPRSRAALRDELLQCGRGLTKPVSPGTVRLSDAVLRTALRVLSAVDRRPGRLVSFVCEKVTGERGQ